MWQRCRKEKVITLFEFEDTVKMVVDRVAGTKNNKYTVFASSTEAAVTGLCWLAQETAAQMLDMKKQPAKSEVAKVEDTRDVAEDAKQTADGAMGIAVEANNMAARNADDIYYLVGAKLPQTTGAKVGQYLMIAAVDEKGKVVKLVPVDAPAAGGIDGDLDMKGYMIDHVSALSFSPPQ